MGLSLQDVLILTAVSALGLSIVIGCVYATVLLVRKLFTRH